LIELLVSILAALAVIVMGCVIVALAVMLYTAIECQVLWGETKPRPDHYSARRRNRA
jgi:hypothetical protein